MPGDHGKPPFALLGRIKASLEQNLYVKDVLPELVQTNLINSAESEIIKQHTSNQECFDDLFRMIDARTRPQTLEIFIKCLDRAGYHHAASLIQKELARVGNYQVDSQRHTQLKIGLVPAQPENYIVRDDYLCKIKQAVIRESDLHDARSDHGTRWILIHGMAGNGKSYLAGAVLRSPEVQLNCFQSGVFWLDIGKPGGEKLLIKLGMLLQMVDPKTLTPSALLPTSASADTIIPRLANIFATQFPNSAIVLDDVWDESVVQTFEKIAVKCIIVTSRRADIAKRLRKVVKIEIDSGFTEAESKEFLSKILDEQNLPTQAELIHKECDGAPMIISLIGGLLRENPGRWETYLKKLQEMPENVISMTNYENRTVEDTIAISVEHLKDDLKEKFFDFALFDDDVPVPVYVFQTLWSFQDMYTAEDEMAYFVNSSLCSTEYCPDRQCRLYRFHDLILHYARKNFPVPNADGTNEKEKQAQREDLLMNKHRKLYYKYYSSCSGRFENLENDFYIHAFIGYHMSQGKLLADLQTVYKNGLFLRKRLEFVGPEVVMVDIKLLKKQHPFLTDLLVKIESQIKNEYKVNSPKVDRRSKAELKIPSRRGSESDINVPSLFISTSPPSDSKLPRLRSSSTGLANFCYSPPHHSESAPTPLEGSQFTLTPSPFKDDKENDEDGITFSANDDHDFMQNRIESGKKLNVRRDLYSQNFGEGD